MPVWPFNKRRPRRLAKWAGLILVIAAAAADIALSIQHPPQLIDLGVIYKIEHDPPIHGRPSREDVHLVIARGAIGVVSIYPHMWQFVQADWFPYFANSRIIWPTRDPWLFTTTFGTYGWTDPNLLPVIPLWMLTLSIALPTTWLWWRDRPSRRQRLAAMCPACGYNLSGLTARAPCPECGSITRLAAAPE